MSTFIQVAGHQQLVESRDSMEIALKVSLSFLARVGTRGEQDIGEGS